MFLEKADLRSAIREYQLDAITDNDDTIVEMAIATAIEQVANLLTPNDKKEWKDGRKHYDVAAIFSATGSGRSALMLANTKTVAIWHLIQLCDTGLTYEEAEGRYDRAIQDVKDLASGVSNSATLPVITAEPPPDDLPFGIGSRRKFNHEY